MLNLSLSVNSMETGAVLYTTVIFVLPDKIDELRTVIADKLAESAPVVERGMTQKGKQLIVIPRRQYIF